MAAVTDTEKAMAYTIHYRGHQTGREQYSRPIEDRNAALQQACDLEQHMSAVLKIVGDDGREIPRAKIDNFLKTKYRR